MKTNLLLPPTKGWRKLKSYALFFITILFSSFLFSQDNLWVMGDQLIDFNDQGNVTASNLPQPNFLPEDPEYPFVYHGEVAESSQNAMWDQDGNLLFFIVDGNVYDAEGYMIADNNDDENCRTCLSKGHITQYIIAQKPGSCTQYYLLTATVERSIDVSVLDLTLQNIFHDGVTRRGSLVDMSNGYGTSLNFLEPDDLFYDFFNQDYSSLITQYSNLSITDLIEYYNVPFLGADNSTGDNIFTAYLPYPYKDDHTEEGINIELIDNNTNDNKELLVFTNGCVSRYTVTAEGVFGIEVHTEYDNFTLPTGHEMIRVNDLESVSTEDGYMLAGFNPGNVGSVIDEGYSIWIWKLDENFNILERNIISIQEPNSGHNYYGLSLEFSQNGEYLYFNGYEYATNAEIISRYDFGVIETSSLTLEYVTDYVTNISNLEDITFGQLESNFAGSEDALYIPSAGGISVLSNLEDLDNLVYTPNVFQGFSLASIDGLDNLGFQGLSNFYISTNQVTVNTAQEVLLRDECCEVRSNYSSAYDPTFGIGQGNVTWTYGNNPFSNTTDPVKITGDLVFNQGTYNINNMTFEFSPESNVIINEGASVTLNGSTWTSYTCDGLMWPGVNLLGNSDQPQILMGQNPNQGMLKCLNNSTIENALIGVQVGTNFTNSGGILVGVDSNFRNNQVDVDFLNYQNYQSYYDQNWDLSRFENCMFITDDELKDSSLDPLYHARLLETYHVDFED